MNCIFLRRGYGTSGIDYADNFADNDWATIANVCAAGLVPATWAVGDQKAMTINGTSYAIDIIGIQHDDFADGSGKAPFTFQLHSLYSTDYAMNPTKTNVGGWTESAMRTTHLPSVYALMPSEVQTAIKEINKKTAAGNASSTINTTADKLFLLSEFEVFGKAQQTYSGEGSQYAYYSEGNSKVKYKSGSAYRWGTRSPTRGTTEYFCRITDAGAIDNTGAIYVNGISFAFCFGNAVGGNNTGGTTNPDGPFVVKASGSITGNGDYTISLKNSGQTYYYYDMPVSFAAEKGETITVQIETSGQVQITHNGTIVKQGSSSASYDFTLNSDCTIVASGYTCAITT